MRWPVVPLLRSSGPRCGRALVLAALVLARAGSAPAESFEAPAVLPAPDVVPARLLSSPSHRVESPVRLEDNLLRMEVTSDFGVYDVTSLALLEIRVHELSVLSEAIAQYERHNAELAGELRGRLRIPGDANVQVLAAPLGAASDLSIQLAGNDPILAARGAIRIESRSPGELALPAEGAAYGSHVRNVAYQLRLDPYSSNPHVQSFLATLAGARAQGRFSAGTGLVLSAPERVSRGADRGRIDAEVARLLRHFDAEQLHAGLRAEIVGMGAAADVAQKFLGHPWYSPRTRASITAHADHLRDVSGRDALIAAALGARTEAEAISFDQLARMLAVYHDEIGRIERLVPGGSALPGAIRADGALLLMLPVDYVHWSPDARATFDSLRAAEVIGAARPVELVVSGSVSPRARRELAARRVNVRESFLVIP